MQRSKLAPPTTTANSQISIPRLHSLSTSRYPFWHPHTPPERTMKGSMHLTQKVSDVH